eukprot:403336041
MSQQQDSSDRLAITVNNNISAKNAPIHTGLSEIIDLETNKNKNIKHKRKISNGTAAIQQDGFERQPKVRQSFNQQRQVKLEVQQPNIQGNGNLPYEDINYGGHEEKFSSHNTNMQNVNPFLDSVSNQYRANSEVTPKKLVTVKKKKIEDPDKNLSTQFFVKILLLGDTGVGKSSLMFRFSEGEFKQGLVGTAGVDYKMKNIEFIGKSVKIQIWDTAGQERYRTLTKAYYKGAAGIILVFDVTDPVSFKNLEYWLKKIHKHADENVEIVLIGNKIDLVNDVQIQQDIANQIAQQKNIQYFEASAKDSYNVDMAFKTLLSNIINNQGLQDKITQQDNNKGIGINNLGQLRLGQMKNKYQSQKNDKSKCC